MTGRPRTLLVVEDVTTRPITGGALRGQALAAALAATSDLTVFEVRPKYRTFECSVRCDRRCWLTRLDHAGADLRDPFFGYYCARAAEALRDLVTGLRPDAVIVSDLRLHQYFQAAAAAGARRLVIDMHNAEGDMYAAMGDRALTAGETAEERLAGVRALERHVTAVAAATTVVCAADGTSIRDRYDVDVVRVVPNTVSVSGHARPVTPRAEDGVRLLFTGALRWPQNTVAARTLVREIFPLLREKLPNATLTLAGLDPPAEFREMRDANVTVLANSPDIRPLFREAVFVAPLEFGGGGRFKLLESFALGASVVATGKGAEGIRVVPDQHYLKAETPADFVAGIMSIAEDPPSDLHRRQAAFDLVRERYSWKSTQDQMRALLAEIA